MRSTLAGVNEVALAAVVGLVLVLMVAILTGSVVRMARWEVRDAGDGSLEVGVEPGGHLTRIVITVFGFLLLGAGMGLYGYHVLVRPVERLVRSRAPARAAREGPTALETVSEELQRARGEMKRWGKDLEKKMMARTCELEAANREVVETWGQLLEAERLASLGQMASSILHEMKNPMQNITNAMYELRRVGDGLADGALDGVSVIEREIQRMDRTIETLRDLSELSSEVETEWCEINDVVERAIAVAVQHDALRKIRVEKRLVEDLPMVSINRHQFEQVFANLLLNGAQAMPEGGAVTVETAGNGSVFVSVTDGGAGIRPGDEKKIFAPFFTTRKQKGGTGLGLAICQGVVKRAGGRIEVKSSPGQGSTFTVMLPVKRPEGCT